MINELDSFQIIKKRDKYNIKNIFIKNKNNYLINNLVTYINEMLNKKIDENKKINENTNNIKKELTRFIDYKISFHHQLLFELFYNINHYNIISYELLDYLSFYYKHLLNMIKLKKSIKSTDLSILELKISHHLDFVLKKNVFTKKNMLIEKIENINERNKFFKYKNDDTIFIKKVEYIKYKINQNEYEFEFDIFDKVNEILLQTNIYNYYEKEINCQKMYYNPIPKIYGFYHTISNIEENGNIINGLYIEMEEINGIRLDNYLHKKMFILNYHDENDKRSVAIKNLKDILNVYIMICRLLIPLQNNLHFIHCDLKGSNILIDKNRRLRFIDFEYSYIKKDGYHIFSHHDFYFSENYNIFNSKKDFTLDLIKLYTSPYRFSSDLLYLFLASLCYKNEKDIYEIQKYLIDYIFKIKNVNMYEILITHKLPYEAYVYSKDMDLLSKICNMYFVNFEEFIMRFNPQNMIHILNELLYNLS